MKTKTTTSRTVASVAKTDKGGGPVGQPYTFLLPVTVVALHIYAEDTVLGAKTQAKIEKLILGDLEKVGHAEVTGVEVCDQLFLLEDINAAREQSIFNDVEKIEEARRRGKVITEADMAILDEALSIVKAKCRGKRP